LTGGPIARLRDGDRIRIRLDQKKLEGSVDLVGEDGSVDTGSRELESRPQRTDLQADPNLPPFTRLWAALQQPGGGTWGGCVYDVDQIVSLLAEGQRRQWHSPWSSDRVLQPPDLID
jgi:dihydroxyacid dehydratase/phosphogluconate dehydratase